MAALGPKLTCPLIIMSFDHYDLVHKGSGTSGRARELLPDTCIG